MKPSERIRAGVQDFQNRVYRRLSPRMRKRVNKAYRLKKKAEPKVQNRAQKGKQDLKRILLGSSKNLESFTRREVMGVNPRRRRRRVVGK